MSKPFRDDAGAIGAKDKKPGAGAGLLKSAGTGENPIG
jgi:hypothetical protein